MMYVGFCRMAGERTARERAELLRLLPSASPRWLAALTAAVVVNALVPAAFAVAVGLLVSRVPAAVDAGLESPEGGALVVALAWVAAMLLLERVLVPVLEVQRYGVSRQVDGVLRSRVLVALEQPAGIAHLEEPEVQNLLGLVHGGLFGTAGAAAVAALGIVGRYLQTLAAVAIVAWFSVPLALAVLVVIVVIRSRWHRAFGQLADALISSGGELRKVTYTADLALTPPAAKELRVFGLVDWLVARARVIGRTLSARPSRCAAGCGGAPTSSWPRSARCTW